MPGPGSASRAVQANTPQAQETQLRILMMGCSPLLLLTSPVQETLRESFESAGRIACMDLPVGSQMVHDLRQHYG
jgi:hypothetical protein